MGLFDWLFSPFRKSASSFERLLLSVLGAPTSSGVSVTPDTAMQAAAVYACVSVLSESVAQLPIHLYRRKGQTKEIAYDHPLYRLLHDQPNSWQTSFEYRSMCMSHILLRGHSISYKNRLRSGRIAELIPIHPDSIHKIEQDSTTYEIAVTVRTKTGEAQFKASELLFLRGLTLDGLTGITPIRYCRDTIGLAIAAEQHGARLFGNGAKPGGILTMPGTPKDETVQKLREDWQTTYSGDNAHKVAVLYGGLEFKPLTMSNEDAQYLETRKFQRSEIASLFRVPAHLINDLEKATFSNVEHLGLSFVVHSLMPWLIRWEQAIYRDLLTQEEQKTYYAKHNAAGLLRGDVKSRFEAYGMAIKDGWMLRNEARDLEDMNPVAGLDEPIMPLNMAIVGSDGKPIALPASEPAKEATNAA